MSDQITPDKSEDVYENGDLLVSFEILADRQSEWSSTEDNRPCLCVSSVVLSIISPVFKAMLNPSHGFKKWRIAENGMKVLDLSTESFEAARIVMNIIHYRPSKNPKIIGLQLLHEIATFCDLYQLQEPIGFSIMQAINIAWCETFAETCITIPNKSFWSPCPRVANEIHPHSSSKCSQWLWVGCVFKIDRIIQECGHHAVKYISKPPNSKEYILGGENFQPIMSRFTKAIWTHREKILDQLLKSVKDISLQFRQAAINKTTVCKKDIDSGKNCDICQMGSLFQLRSRLGYSNPTLDHLDLMAVHNIFRSVDSCGSKITFSGIVPIGDGSLREPDSHASCDLAQKFRDISQPILDYDGRVALLDDFYQRSKCGAGKGNEDAEKLRGKKE